MLNFILVGCGRIAQKHINAALDCGLIIDSLVDLDSNKLNLLVSNNNLRNVKILNNISEALINDSIDILTIATSSDSHFEISKKALESSINLIIEKPVFLSLQDIDDIQTLINLRKNIKLTVVFQNRFNKCTSRLNWTIKNGLFGKLFYGVATIRWNRNESYYSQAEWRGKWKSDGGALMNQSIHNIDLLIWMMGSPVVEVFGYIDNKNNPSIEVEDMGVALLKFANGSFGIIESSMNTYPENFEETLSIFGEKGTVVLGGKSVNKIVHWNVKDDPIDDLEAFNEEVDSVYGNGHIALYKDFIEAIKDDREPAITLQDGRNAVEVILAIYKSSFEKCPVSLPLPPETSTIMFEGKSFT
jgi:predicted dehydrogenase